MQRIIVEKRDVNGIPLLTVCEEGARNSPLVFIIHGFTGDKTAEVALAYLLAEAGCFAVLPDAYLHGDRPGERLARSFQPEHAVYPPDTGLDPYFLLHEIVEHTAADVSNLIDHFTNDPRVDADRVGVTGPSMGGFTTFVLAAREPRISAAAPMISFPALLERWEDVLAETSSYERWAGPLAALEDETARRTAFVRALDPMQGLMDYAPKPLLMIQGDIDTDAPKVYSVKLYRALQPLYAGHPDRLKLSVYDGVAHRVTSIMRGEVRDWMVRFLKPGT